MSSKRTEFQVEAASSGLRRLPRQGRGGGPALTSWRRAQYFPGVHVLCGLPKSRWRHPVPQMPEYIWEDFTILHQILPRPQLERAVRTDLFL